VSSPTTSWKNTGVLVGGDTNQGGKLLFPWSVSSPTTSWKNTGVLVGIPTKEVSFFSYGDAMLIV
jgi:hypothetical protein